MLNLSPRHKAMLQEMGVPLWWPDPAAGARPAGEGAPQGNKGMALPVRDMAPSAPRPAPPAPRVAAAPSADSVPSPRMPRPALTPPAAVPRPAARATAETDDFVPIAPSVDLRQVGWAALSETVAQCRACRLCLQRTNTVFGVGTLPEPHPDQALDWLVVGEGPGEQEDLQGEPFVGAAGKLLDQMLAAMRLSRQRTGDDAPSLYITNVVKCRPPGNRNPMPDEVEACSPHLQAQIRLLRPRFILAMGRFAAQTLLKDSVADIDTVALGKLRGTVHRHGDIPVVVSYHPSYLLRNPAEKAKSWADLCLALQAWDDTNRTV